MPEAMFWISSNGLLAKPHPDTEQYCIVVDGKTFCQGKPVPEYWITRDHGGPLRILCTKCLAKKNETDTRTA